MNELETIRRILAESRVIAIVGLSDKPYRASFDVAMYLKEHGYRIIPVNPNIRQWMGETSYPDLKSVPEPIDVVDIFRRSEFVAEIVDQAIEVKAKAVWMQLGVVDEVAARRAEEAGLMVVMGRCMKIEHSRL